MVGQNSHFCSNSCRSDENDDGDIDAIDDDDDDDDDDDEEVFALIEDNVKAEQSSQNDEPGEHIEKVKVSLL